jgi:hypothetical protein
VFVVGVRKCQIDRTPLFRLINAAKPAAIGM